MKQCNTNKSSNQEQPIPPFSAEEPELNYYCGLPQSRRVDHALEMIDEIKERDNRIFCVLSAAIQELERSPDDITMGVQLAKVAEELLWDFEQKHRLRDCIRAMEVKHG